MTLRFFLCALLLLMLFSTTGYSQADTTKPQPAVVDSIPVAPQSSKKVDKKEKAVEDTASKKWGPGKRAAVYSAILPGAGQAYNKKYWKMPLVYGALAIPTYTFFDNLSWFQNTRLAYNLLSKRDTANYKNIDPRLRAIVDRGDLNSLKNYRNSFRKNVDYSVLAFLLLWGLNVVDAAVDGHLRDFNVTDDLSLQIKSGYMPIGNTNGVGIVLNIGKNHVNRSYSGR